MKRKQSWIGSDLRKQRKATAKVHALVAAVNVVDMPEDDENPKRLQTSFPSEFPVGDGENKAIEGPELLESGRTRSFDAEIGQGLNDLATDRHQVKNRQQLSQPAQWNESYHNDNISEDADLKLGECEDGISDAKQPPYSDELGPLNSRYEDVDRSTHNIVTHANTQKISKSEMGSRPPWVCVDLDGTIFTKPKGHEYQDKAGNHIFGNKIRGSDKALRELIDGGARVSIYANRNVVDKKTLRKLIAAKLVNEKLPFTDIFIGTEPPADVYFTAAIKGDWDLALDTIRDRLNKHSAKQPQIKGLSAENVTKIYELYTKVDDLDRRPHLRPSAMKAKELLEQDLRMRLQQAILSLRDIYDWWLYFGGASNDQGPDVERRIKQLRNRLAPTGNIGQDLATVSIGLNTAHQNGKMSEYVEMWGGASAQVLDNLTAGTQDTKWKQEINRFAQKIDKQLLDEIKIMRVPGDEVRNNQEIDFTMGGHHYKYPDIPEDEVWIDDELTEADDIIPTEAHELTERTLQKNLNMEYDEAHDIANITEQGVRDEMKSRTADKKTDLMKKYPNIANEIDKVSKDIDPKYLQWFAKELNAGNQSVKIIDYINEFEANKEFLENIDIYKYSLDQLIAEVTEIKKYKQDLPDLILQYMEGDPDWFDEQPKVVQKLLKKEDKKKKKTREKVRGTEANARKWSDVIYEDENFLVVHPGSIQSSQFFGSGTQWCIASTDPDGPENAFVKYSDDEVCFYFIINKKSNLKDPLGKIAFAISPNKEIIYNRMDETITLSKVIKYLGNSKLIDLIKSDSKNREKSKYLENMQNEEFAKNLTTENPRTFFKYDLHKVHPELGKQSVRELINSHSSDFFAHNLQEIYPELAQQAATNLTKQDPNSFFQHKLQETYPELTQQAVTNLSPEDFFSYKLQETYPELGKQNAVNLAKQKPGIFLESDLDKIYPEFIQLAAATYVELCPMDFFDNNLHNLQKIYPELAQQAAINLAEINPAGFFYKKLQKTYPELGKQTATNLIKQDPRTFFSYKINKIYPELAQQAAVNLVKQSPDMFIELGLDKIYPELLPDKQIKQSFIEKFADDEVKDTKDYHGIKIDIEWPKGSIRSYEGSDTYVTHMLCSYGYARGIEGSDGDQLDIYLGDGDSDTAYIVDQLDDEGNFDEQKVLLGFDSEAEAADIYLQHMPGYMLGDIREVPVDKLKNALYGDPEDRRSQDDLVPSEEQDQKSSNGMTKLPDGSGFFTGVVGSRRLAFILKIASYSEFALRALNSKDPVVTNLLSKFDRAQSKAKICDEIVRTMLTNNQFLSQLEQKLGPVEAPRRPVEEALKNKVKEHPSQYWGWQPLGAPAATETQPIVHEAVRIITKLAAHQCPECDMEMDYDEGRDAYTCDCGYIGPNSPYDECTCGHKRCDHDGAGCFHDPETCTCEKQPGMFSGERDEISHSDKESGILIDWPNNENLLTDPDETREDRSIDRRDITAAPVVREIFTRESTRDICPYCNKEIHEKSVFYDKNNDLWYHRPCKDEGPIESPKNPKAQLAAFLGVSE